MLQSQKTLLRAISRGDLERLWQFNNDVEVEVAGGGDPPIPQSLGASCGWSGKRCKRIHPKQPKLTA